MKKIYETIRKKCDLKIKNRSKEIDLLKGLATILVVWGHVIQYGDNLYMHNPLFKIIYSFHMPLFIFLSGYVSEYSVGKKENYGLKYLRKRFVQLMVPFFSWAIIATTYTTIFDIFREKDILLLFETFLQYILTPEKGLWFLWVLFFFNVIHLIYKRISKIYKIFLCIGVLIIYILPVPDVFGMTNIRTLVIYYIIGCLINGCGLFSKNCKKKAKIISGIMASISIIIIITSNSHVYIIPKEMVFDSLFVWHMNQIIRYLLASAQICFLIIICKCIVKNRYVFCGILQYIGTLSLEIYAVQVFPTKMLEIVELNRFNFIFNNIVIFPIVTCMLVLLCIFISDIVKKNRILTYLLFGKLLNVEKESYKCSQTKHY